MAATGSVVAWWDGNRLFYGVVAGEEKGRLVLILPNGKERRLSPRRVAFAPGRVAGRPAPTQEARRLAGRQADEVAGRVRSAAESIDVSLLWGLALESGEPPGIRLLAELALGAGDDLSCAAVAHALAADGLHFVRRGDEWEARPAAVVEGIRTQKRRDEQRAGERQAALDAIAEAERGRFRSTGNREERRYLQALEELAVHDREASDEARRIAIEVLEASGRAYDRPHEGAFRILRSVGRFDSDDENLQILRYRLRTRFPEEVVAEARAAAAREFHRQGREDLTGLEVITVDGPSTREIDDGVSLEPLSGDRVRIGVHIADPAAFIEVGSAVDREALARSVTYYLPDARLPMIPKVISEEAASLVPDQSRPAVSFLVEIEPDGEISGYTVFRSVIRSRERLDYERADRMARKGEGRWARLLGELDSVACRREGARVRNGAVRLRAPEVDVKVEPDGRIRLERIDPDSPSRRVVSEAMILAGAVAARFAAERQLPVIYRTQPPPDTAPSLPAEGGDNLAAIRAMRRSLKRGEVGLKPGPHFGLGLSAYAQATSPLRRYQDLTTHRQIVAALEGRAVPHDIEALQRIAASTEQAEVEGRRAEGESDRYWLLRYLEDETGSTVEAVVVEVEPRPVIQLIETLIEQPIPGLGGVSLGQRLRLRIERVNARADLLVLRAEPGPG